MKRNSRKYNIVAVAVSVSVAAATLTAGFCTSVDDLIRESLEAGGDYIRENPEGFRAPEEWDKEFWEAVSDDYRQKYDDMGYDTHRDTTKPTSNEANTQVETTDKNTKKENKDSNKTNSSNKTEKTNESIQADIVETVIDETVSGKFIVVEDLDVFKDAATDTFVGTYSNGDEIDVTGKTDNGFYRISFSGFDAFISSAAALIDIDEYELGWEEVSRVEPTCEKKGLITYENKYSHLTKEEELEIVEHFEGEWTDKKAASYFTPGVKELRCDTCHKVLDTKDIPQIISPLMAVSIVVILILIVITLFVLLKKKKKSI